MSTLRAVDSEADIPAPWLGTPIQRLLATHNLGATLEPTSRPEMAIATCMDYRIRLRLPDDFAYVVRIGGADVREREFYLSFAVAVGGVDAIAVIGHTGCAMAGASTRRDEFVAGLVDRCGWERSRAEEHFDRWAPVADIGEEVAFVVASAVSLSERYPRIPVAPLLYRLDDHRLWVVEA